MRKASTFDYNKKYPSISDLKRRAKQRIPSFAYDYIDGGIDEERGKHRNREAFHNIHLTPSYLTDVSDIDTSINIFGKTYDLPFGVPPVGLGNMMWPGSELALARASQQANTPYVLSTFSTTPMEDIAQLAPDVCWFQLYTPREDAVMKDLIHRAKHVGFNALVVTLDIPVGAKRNRELKNGLQLPFKITPNIIWEAITHPQWTLATLPHGSPEFVNVVRYNTDTDMDLGEFISNFMVTGVTQERVAQIRRLWDGPLILKGIQNIDNALAAIKLGVDGIIVSNHGGRQLDAAPSSIQSLKELPDHVHQKLTVMIDSGVRTGLDVIRAKALGAQMSFSGRSFFWGMGAMGNAGAQQVINIFRDEITRSLQQLGCHRFSDIDKRWIS